MVYKGQLCLNDDAQKGEVPCFMRSNLSLKCQESSYKGSQVQNNRLCRDQNLWQAFYWVLLLTHLPVIMVGSVAQGPGGNGGMSTPYTILE